MILTYHDDSAVLDGLHGFTHDTDNGTTPGVAFDPLADARSHAAIRAFLDELAAGTD